MATLDPPFDGLGPGNHTLQASLLGWHNVGSCVVSVSDKFNFAASGKFSAVGHSGTFDLRLALTDHDENAPSGPCTVTNAGATITGKYTRSGSQISFSDGQHQIVASPDGKNVILQIAGYPKVRILA